MERTDTEAAESTFEAIDAETRCCSLGLAALGLRRARQARVAAVPDEQAKRNILGENARKVFGL